MSNTSQQFLFHFFSISFCCDNELSALYSYRIHICSNLWRFENKTNVVKKKIFFFCFHSYCCCLYSFYSFIFVFHIVCYVLLASFLFAFWVQQLLSLTKSLFIVVSCILFFIQTELCHVYSSVAVIVSFLIMDFCIFSLLTFPSFQPFGLITFQYINNICVFNTEIWLNERNCILQQFFSLYYKNQNMFFNIEILWDD